MPPSVSALTPPPVQTAMLGVQGGLVSLSWARWFHSVETLANNIGAGAAYLANDQTFTGLNTFTQDVRIVGVLVMGTTPITITNSAGYVLTSAIAGGQALTRANDTNVTATLTGSPSTALLAATLITLGWTGQLSIARGGTGQATAAAAFDALAPTTTQGDLIYRNATTNTRLAAGTATQVLHGGLTPSWSAVSLTADVSGILPIANGGTNASSQTSSGVAYFDGTRITTGSALTFDGSKILTVTAAANGVKVSIAGASSGGQPAALVSLVDSTTGTTWNLENGRNASELTFYSGGIQARLDISSVFYVTEVDLGVAGSTKGVLKQAGNTAGVITVQPPASTATWSFTWPTSAGTSGYALITDGAGVTSWVPLSSITGVVPIANGGTNATSQTTNGVAYFDGTKITTGSIVTWDGTTFLVTQASATIQALGTTTGALGRFKASADVATGLYAALGSAFGGTTFGGVTGNSQIVLEAQASSSFYIGTSSAVKMYFAPNRAITMTIDGSNVGIGTATPGRLLEVFGTEAIAQLNGTQSGSNGDYADLLFFNRASSVYAAITATRTGADNSLGFRFDTISAGSTQSNALRILPSGFVGVNVSTPTTRFHVSGAHVAGSGVVKIISSDTAFVHIEGTGAVPTGIRFSNGGTTKWDFYTDANDTDKIKLESQIASHSGVQLTIDRDAVISWGQGSAYGVFTYDTNLAILAGQTGKAVRLSADGAGNNHIYITTAGLVGIGTASPGAPLDVRATTAYTSVQSNTGTNVAFSQWVNTSGLLYAGVESSAGGNLATGSSAYAGVLTTAVATSLQLGTNGAVNMTIASGGRITLTDSLQLANVNAILGRDTGGTYRGILSVSAADICNVGNTALAWKAFGTSFYFATNVVRMDAYGAGAATFDASGNITSVSDERLKRGIRPWARGLAFIAQLETIDYFYGRTSGLEQKHRYVGFGAGQVRTLAPELVFENARGHLSLWERGITAGLVNAVKELKTRVEALEAA